MASEVLSAVFQFAQMVYAANKQVNANKAECNGLASQVQLVMTSVEVFRNHPNIEMSVAIRANLGELQVILREIVEYIQRFSETGTIKKLLLHKSDAAKVEDFYKRLEQQKSNVVLALSVQGTAVHNELMKISAKQELDRAKALAAAAQKDEELRRSQEAHRKEMAEKDEAHRKEAARQAEEHRNQLAAVSEKQDRMLSFVKKQFSNTPPPSAALSSPGFSYGPVVVTPDQVSSPTLPPGSGPVPVQRAVSPTPSSTSVQESTYGNIPAHRDRHVPKVTDTVYQNVPSHAQRSVSPTPPPAEPLYGNLAPPVPPKPMTLGRNFAPSVPGAGIVRSSSNGPSDFGRPAAPSRPTVQGVFQQPSAAAAPTPTPTPPANHVVKVKEKEAAAPRARHPTPQLAVPHTEINLLPEGNGVDPREAHPSANPLLAPPSNAINRRNTMTDMQGDLASASVSLEQYVLRGVLGQGQFTSVTTATPPATAADQRLVAIKRLKRDLTDGELDVFQRELQEVIKISHPLLASIVNVSLTPEHYALVYECIQPGNLTSLLANYDDFPEITWEHKRSILQNIARAMIFLHDRLKKLHLNLKSSNILVDKTMHIWVSDFGFYETRRALRDNAPNRSVPWMAPELLSATSAAAPPTELADVYSFGVIAWELVTRELPYRGQTSDQIIKFVSSGQRLAFPNTPDAAKLQTLISDCWAAQASKRPNFKGVNHAIEKLAK
ncbi:hypothetical protein CAOG_01057 [Capsaspora owczarzaki ATCC 30864]|uniref:hypothetical protein n=1 Tax=Capsaspora owczarzaki (strain ATCC 30864) TaxID=595528 RepID=UPI0003526C25|nr:hypothetical protein CAOG_01057 [Capsaspora owczarzaki ATCC 30864]|eukprot:XP_004365928.2 hypothetical protein CAOG_01057 [Capsaspora owczarzaki ATCC 30864]